VVLLKDIVDVYCEDTGEYYVHRVVDIERKDGKTIYKTSPDNLSGMFITVGGEIKEVGVCESDFDDIEHKVIGIIYG
jgi:hypothetical protein